jgi:hypothetical protein
VFAGHDQAPAVIDFRAPGIVRVVPLGLPDVGRICVSESHLGSGLLSLGHVVSLRRQTHNCGVLIFFGSVLILGSRSGRTGAGVVFIAVPRLRPCRCSFPRNRVRNRPLSHCRGPRHRSNTPDRILDKSASPLALPTLARCRNVPRTKCAVSIRLWARSVHCFGASSILNCVSCIRSNSV